MSRRVDPVTLFGAQALESASCDIWGAKTFLHAVNKKVYRKERMDFVWITKIGSRKTKGLGRSQLCCRVNI
jgi:hypothetical protein